MSPRIFYHGTINEHAYSIMRQGFKVGAKTSGRNLGAGLYLTTDSGFAAAWGPIVIRCALRTGTRILWHTTVDASTIRYLKKEFGAGITQPNFNVVIPQNKQLTKSEAANLWNYLLERNYRVTRPTQRDLFLKLTQNYAAIYKHLKRHGFDGVGIRDVDWPEMFLFNPSNAKPVSAHSFVSSGWRGTWIRDKVELSQPLTLAELEARAECEGASGD